LKDYYEILNVSKDASPDEIKSSYRRLAKKYHPDLNPNDKEAEKRFKEINEAYEILSDPEKRKRYDMFGEAGVNGQGGYSQDFTGFGDIFDDIFDIFGGFGRSSYRARERGPVKGADLRYNLNLEFEEAVFGVEKEVQIRRSESCDTCSGTGVKPGSSKETCSKCKGTGEVRYAQNTAFGQFVRVATCDACGGSGEIIREKCTTCNGNGKVLKNKRIKVKIPAGVDTGSIISVRGEGEAGDRGGPPGDLYVYINVKPHKLFKRQGNDLFITIPISFTEACLGAEIEVPTLEGIEKFNLPAGTQTGTEFKLRNMGVPNVRGIGRGDLHFKVEIQVPKKLTDKQRELLLELDKEFGSITKHGKKGFFKKVKDAFGN